MEKYLDLLSTTAEQLARKAEQGALIIADLERIERLLIAAERKIEITDKAG